MQCIASVREIIAASWPQRFDSGDLTEDASLGEEGLGLDSVELFEVITACEEHFGRLAKEDLFETVPLTIGLMADYFRS